MNLILQLVAAMDTVPPALQHARMVQQVKFLIDVHPGAFSAELREHLADCDYTRTNLAALNALLQTLHLRIDVYHSNITREANDSNNDYPVNPHCTRGC
jgi:hypothetical protein